MFYVCVKKFLSFLKENKKKKFTKLCRAHLYPRYMRDFFSRNFVPRTCLCEISRLFSSQGISALVENRIGRAHV